MQKLIKLILTANFTLFVAISITIIILFLSLIKTDNLPETTIDQADKFYHLLAYFGLSFTWFIYASVGRNWKQKKSFFVIALVIITFGIIVEVLQLMVTSYRSFDWYDALANSFGVLLALLFFIFLNSKIKRLQNNA
ncbi:MAG: VanZ family protein [Bacteroidota bacterium]